jgi:hypothetical protein
VEWVKLSAVPAYYHDPALLRSGEAAEVLFCRALAHCGSVESAGIIDKNVLPLLCPTKPQARADALVREGLWLDEGAHYRIRSWDKWQDQHDVAAEKRRKDRERQREYRRRSRDGNPETSREMSRDSHGDKRDSHSLEGDREGDREKKTPSETPQGFAEFWMAYPKKKDRGAALRAYRKALKATDAETLISAAKKYAALRQGQDPAYTKHASTWLNAESWSDEPDGTAQPKNWPSHLPPFVPEVSPRVNW